MKEQYKKLINNNLIDDAIDLVESLSLEQKKKLISELTNEGFEKLLNNLTFDYETQEWLI
jgi:Mg/Co/Ni transporter MgtE